MANGVLFLSVNIAGIFIHYLTQRSQRKTFIDTRNCIAARLEIQEENEKLVSVHTLGQTFCQFVIQVSRCWHTCTDKTIQQ